MTDLIIRANVYINVADLRPNAYFNSVQVLKLRNSLARLLVRLEIGAGRWVMPYKHVHERLCTNCNRLE